MPRVPDGRGLDDPGNANGELDVGRVLGGPAQSATLVATVAERLRARILDGGLPPGTALRLRPLAETLGVSIMPVREALHRLEAEQLVIVRPHRGAVVADLSVDDAEEIYTLRVALEALCARHAGERLTADDVEELESLFQRMADAQRDGDLRAFIDADHAFHARLYAVSGRDRLIRMIGELQGRSGRYLEELYTAWRMVDNPLEAHRPILAAIQSRDAMLIERLTRAHMEEAFQRLLRALAQDGSGRPQGPSGRGWRVGAGDRNGFGATRA